MSEKSKSANLPTTKEDAELATKFASAILGFIAEVPKSTEVQNADPEAASRSIATKAALQAAGAAGALALPPGPMGWLTILPEMVTVWKIQASMVADIAALYGKTATLDQEQMLYCLFKHTASQAVRDIVVRVGERYIVKRASLRVMQAVLQRIGVKVTQRTLAKAASRWLPIVGALGVGAYAYYDTAQVADTAIKLFKGEVEVRETSEATA